MRSIGWGYLKENISQIEFGNCAPKPCLGPNVKIGNNPRRNAPVARRPPNWGNNPTSARETALGAEVGHTERNDQEALEQHQHCRAPTAS